MLKWTPEADQSVSRVVNLDRVALVSPLTFLVQLLSAILRIHCIRVDHEAVAKDVGTAHSESRGSSCAAALHFDLEFRSNRDCYSATNSSN